MSGPTIADLAARLTLLEQKISHLEHASTKLGDRYDATRDKLQALEVQMAEVKAQMAQILETGQSTLDLLKRQVERDAQRQSERDSSQTAIKRRQLEISHQNWKQLWKFLAGVVGLMAAAASGGYATFQLSHPPGEGKSPPPALDETPGE